MRPIDADKVMDALYDAGIELYRSEYEEFQARLNKMPTIDPETLRPAAHIMRGTVRDTYDNAFCSSCRSCLNGDEYFGEVLAHRYKYCPYCSARFVSADE